MKQEIIRIDLGGVNSYILKSDNQFILIDTGGHIVMDKEFKNRSELLEQALEKHGCNSGNLKLILLTHGDNDHVCNAAYLRNKYKTKIAIHKDDFYLVQNPTINDFMNSFNYQSFLFKIVFKIMKNTIHKVTVKTLKDFKVFSPDISIDENFNLNAFGFDSHIIHIPGHTPGSIGIFTNDRNIIVGDTFANIKKPSIAPNAINFKQLYESVDKLKSYKINTVYPGHGEPFAFKDLWTK